MEKIIAFKKLKQQKKLNLKIAEIKQFGILIWLYCPQCKSLQYTAKKAPNGRAHKCGNEIVEIEVPLDLRAEYTICLKNLQILEKIKKSAKKEKKELSNINEAILYCSKIELQKIEKLKEANGSQELIPYSWSKKLSENLPIAYVNSSGLMVSEFSFKPNQRFQLFGINVK